MKTTIMRTKLLPVFVLAFTVTAVAKAEDVEKKFRIGFGLGLYDTTDEVRSDSANFLRLLDSQNRVNVTFEDPRNDAAAIGSLQIESAPRATFTAQYAFTKLFVLEGAIGYQKGDVGSVEMQVQFSGENFNTQRNNFNFQIYDLNAGTLTEIPLQLSALARFRPKATLSPYVGAGIGYVFTGFEPDSTFDQISQNLDRSTGGFAQLQQNGGGLSSPTSFTNMGGAEVGVPDTFEWHLVGGGEFSVAKKWSVFLDARYVWASREFHIGFNGKDSIGVSVPDGLKDQDSVFLTTPYGAFVIKPGLIDAGCSVPISAVQASAGGQVTCAQDFCAANPQQCTFVRTGTNNVTVSNDEPEIPVTLLQSDGALDSGLYYLKGGNIQYGGLSLQVGMRFTF